MCGRNSRAIFVTAASARTSSIGEISRPSAGTRLSARPSPSLPSSSMLPSDADSVPATSKVANRSGSRRVERRAALTGAPPMLRRVMTRSTRVGGTSGPIAKRGDGLLESLRETDHRLVFEKLAREGYVRMRVADIAGARRKELRFEPVAEYVGDRVKEVQHRP